MGKDNLRRVLFASVWATCAATVYAQDSGVGRSVQAGVENPLAAQAQYWTGKGRFDLARESWLKLRRSDARNTQALVGLVEVESRSGRPDEAQKYLSELQAISPRHPDIGRLTAGLQTPDRNKNAAPESPRLVAARAFARQGKYSDAVAEYKQHFAGKNPTGRLGLEYFQTLAGTSTGWDEARDGIAKLARENSNDAVYKLALAQHLTYREESRREGITQLSGLTSMPTIGGQARQAWRQGLIWLGIKPGDEPLYREFITRFGEDAQVSAKLSTLNKPAPAAVAKAPGTTGPAAPAAPVAPTVDDLRGRVLKDAFELLNAGQLEQAESRFNESIRQYGDSADAAGGLGIIALRKENYGVAAQLLQKAVSMNPARGARWTEALGSARFWDSVRGAEAARTAGDSVTAERLLRRAIEVDPARASRQVSVISSLADILAQRGEYAEAERLYTDVLKKDPNNLNATRALMGIYAMDDRLAEAIRLADSSAPDVRDQLAPLGAIKAQNFRKQAEAALAQGETVRGEALLREALILEPDSPWTRLDLARIYQRQGRTREANTLIDGLLASGTAPIQPEALFIKAMLLDSQQSVYEALQVLERINPAARTPDMAKLQQRMWVRYQAQRAGVFAKIGRKDEALSLLATVEPYVEEMPELLGAIATGYADLGDESRALRYMRQALARNPKQQTSLRLQYASLLLKLQQDAEFEILMESMLKAGGLTPEQSLDLANLRIGYRLRQADLLREEGQLARAYESLEPLLNVNANDTRVMMALARLYTDSKDHEQAYRIYLRVLELNPDDLDAIKSAAGSALSMQHLDDADALLQRAMAQDDSDPRVYAMAGRVARGRGDDGRARKLFERALELDAIASGQKPQTSSQPLLRVISPSPLAAVDAQPWPSALATDALRPLAAQKTLVQPKQIKVAALAAKTLPVVKGYRWVPGAMVRVKARLVPFYGDVAIPSGRTHAAGLIKVSTLATRLPSAVQTASPTNGYWAEEPSSDGSLSYRFVESTPAAPAIAKPKLPAAAYTGRPVLPTPKRLEPVVAIPEYQPQAAPIAASPRIAPVITQPAPPTYSTHRSAPIVAQPVTPSYDYGSSRGYVYEVPRLESSTQPMIIERPMSEMQVYQGPVSAPAPMIVDESARPAFARTKPLPESNERKALLRELTDLRVKNTGYLSGGFGLRSRDGVDGLDRLYNVETPVEVAFAAGERGKFKLRANPVYLNAGTVEGDNLPLFGTLGLASFQNPTVANRRFDQNESGVAVGVGFEAGNFSADIGSTPLGFPVETVVGGLNWRPNFDQLSLKLDLSRRSVSDSLLSYAGVKDPGTGFTWGGITKSGGRVDASYAIGEYGVYINGAFHTVDGRNVPQNTVSELGVGVYARAIERRNLRVTYGLNLTGFAYKKNLRHFTFGHGGYFSPQTYFSVGIPVELEGYRDRLSYKLNATLGIQAFEEDGAALYPNNSRFQNALDNALASNDPLLALNPLTVPGGFSSKRQNGVGYSFGGQMEYLLDPNLALGGRFSVDNARDYTEALATGYVRYIFNGQTRVSLPPWQLNPNFNYGDPRL